MAAVTSAVVGTAATGYSMYQGRRAERRAGRQMDQQAAAQQRALDVEEDRLAWAKQTYDEWQQEFAPVLGELRAEAMAGRTPDYAAIAADVTSAFAGARGQEQRAQERHGIRPGDGQYGAGERRHAIGAATAEVGARETARRNVGDERFRRLGQVYGIGANMQSQAMGMIGGAYGGVSGAHGQMAGMHGNQAGFHGNQAGQYGQMAAGAGASAFGQWADIIDGAMADTPQQATGGGSFFGIQAPEGTSGTAPWRDPEGP